MTDPESRPGDDDDKVDVYVDHDLGDGGFMQFFAKLYLCLGTVACLVAFVLGDLAQGLSFCAGFLAMVLLLVSQRMTLAMTLKPHATTWWWESLVVFLRYILLGLVFYAMIRLFVVRWPWFIAGISLIVPGLLCAVLFFKNPEPD